MFKKLFFGFALGLLAFMPLRASAATQNLYISMENHRILPSLTLHVGDTLVMKAQTNFGTPYFWNVGIGNNTMLFLNGSNFVLPNGVPGSPTSELFTFTAKKSGNTPLIIYLRTASAQTVWATIQVVILP